MTDTTDTNLAPVTGTSRIDVLDILRGIAILGIFFMNIPYMAASLPALFVDVRLLGWTPVDQASWTAVQVLLEGTQRGMLQLLFGAGMMVLTARAMQPDGPVAIADLYFRRNLWLLAFGLADIFLLFWAGDILHLYAIAALFLFPFRKLGARWLLVLAMGFALFTAVTGGIRYAERADLMHRAESAQTKAASGAKLDKKETKAVEDWKKAIERRKGNSPDFQEMKKQEIKGHSGGFLDYAMLNIGLWFFIVADGGLYLGVIEAFCVMLLGIALWKWEIIQGGRSARFYAVLMLGCYAFALPLRWMGAQEMLTMVPIPRSFWATQEFARIAASVGHLALINLLVKSGAGRAILAPFKAAGRTAFSLYFMQTIIGLWILFAPWGPGLWGKLSWGGMHSVVIAVIAGQVILANIWVRYFTSGPLEWAWRSLAYVKRQPFRRRHVE
ncbi:DUF418 domain-containing protein [Sphingomonas sp. G-3-2-10]|uniref:DUF418 domain-containing protein n=1 Tax=Sphingomonas sp. G-3-2-10 TaxID=2728838 RepID=UPI00146E92A3|nr:DUF418 domain-containing protein [Sphingomonas sp. G-3-2-10]NML04658.1 DUF418 domain-containing protein [Sphingomonas sp. G-3-2-10]